MSGITVQQVKNTDKLDDFQDDKFAEVLSSSPYKFEQFSKGIMYEHDGRLAPAKPFFATAENMELAKNVLATPHFLLGTKEFDYLLGKNPCSDSVKDDCMTMYGETFASSLEAEGKSFKAYLAKNNIDPLKLKCMSFVVNFEESFSKNSAKSPVALSNKEAGVFALLFGLDDNFVGTRRNGTQANIVYGDGTIDRKNYDFQLNNRTYFDEGINQLYQYMFLGAFGK